MHAETRIRYPVTMGLKQEENELKDGRERWKGLKMREEHEAGRQRWKSSIRQTRQTGQTTQTVA